MHSSSVTVFYGDLHFSSWSFRALALLAMSKVQNIELYVPLEWPFVIKNGAVQFIDLDTLPSDDASYCPCDMSSLLAADTTGLCKSDALLLSHAHVPVLVDEVLSMTITTHLAIVDYVGAKASERGVHLLGDSAHERYAILDAIAHVTSDFLPLMSDMSFAKSLKPESLLAQRSLQGDSFLLFLENLLKQGCSGYPFGKPSAFEASMSPFAQQFLVFGYPMADYSFAQAYLHRIRKAPFLQSLYDRAVEPYRKIMAHVPQTPAWIAAHYRYRPELKLIHDWQSNVLHTLDNDVACLMFELAYQGQSTDEIIRIVLQSYDVSESVARDDVEEFFKSISPRANASLTDKTLLNWNRSPE